MDIHIHMDIYKYIQIYMDNGFIYLVYTCIYVFSIDILIYIQLDIWIYIYLEWVFIQYEFVDIYI